VPSGNSNHLASLAGGSVDLPQFRRLDHTTFAGLVASSFIAPSYVRARPENKRGPPQSSVCPFQTTLLVRILFGL
jgi:hypothetical protein